MKQVKISSKLQKIIPNCLREIEKKKKLLIDLYEQENDVSPRLPKRLRVFDTVDQNKQQEDDLYSYLEYDKPIIVKDKFEKKVQMNQKYRDDTLNQSEKITNLDGMRHLFRPRSNNAQHHQEYNKKLSERERQESIDQEKLKIQEMDRKRQEELEEQRLNDLPMTIGNIFHLIAKTSLQNKQKIIMIDEIEKLREENIIVQYKGGAQLKEQSQNQVQQIESSHQRQISLIQEFNNSEKVKNVFQDDYLQYISFNPTYDDDIHPKNKFNPLLDFSSLSRDLLIQNNNVKKQMMQNCIDILHLEDILINKEDLKIYDIVNIISERINQNQLKYIFSEKGIFDLAKQVSRDNEPLKTKKKYCKQTNKSWYENVSYVNNIKDLKQINALQELKHTIHVAGYKDQSCEANQFDIIEETKEEIDWALEDFYFIKYAKDNVDQFPPFFEGAQELQNAIQKRFEDSLIDLLRIFLGVSKEDYYDKKTVKYEDLMLQLKQIIKNPQSIVDQKIQGHQKVKILYIFLKDFLAVVQREEKVIEQIKLIHSQLSEKEQQEKKEQSKPSYIKDYEKGTIKQRKHNQNKIFTVINKLQDQSKIPFK